MSEVKPCPCGEVPPSLFISGDDQGDKYMRCMGNCCGTWEIEFRAQYLPKDSPELYASAVDAWNEAPRSISGQSVAAEAYQIIGALAGEQNASDAQIIIALDYFSALANGEKPESILPWSVK